LGGPTRFKLDLTGVDQNPLSARAAAEATAFGRPIRFVTANIFAYQPPSQVDIVISSLMTHQMEDTSIIRFISWMEANAAIGWFVNDLRRNALPYHLFHVTSRVLRLHEFVRMTARLSIACAFEIGDWQRLLDSAGIQAQRPKSAGRFHTGFAFHGLRPDGDDRVSAPGSKFGSPICWRQ